MKLIIPFLLLFIQFACHSKKDISPEMGDAFYNDGINPTTEREIFDSQTPITGTILKSMKISSTSYSYYYGSEQFSSNNLNEVYDYEYDANKRLEKVDFTSDDFRKRRISTFIYNSTGELSKIKLNWFNFYNDPYNEEILNLESDQGALKVVAKGTYAPYFPPINPDNASYKNLLVINAKKQVQQLPHCYFMPDAMNAYVGFSLDSKSNLNSVTFNFVSKQGELLHYPLLKNMEYTKYVRSPFNSYAFTIAHHLTNVYQDLIDFGINMPTKVSRKVFYRSEGIESRFGYMWGEGTLEMKENYTYYYNALKLPTMMIKELKFEEARPARIDTVRFSYE